MKKVSTAVSKQDRNFSQPTARHGTEDFLQRFRGRAHSLLQLYLARFIQQH